MAQQRRTTPPQLMWEHLTTADGLPALTFRARIPGGWLIYVYYAEEQSGHGGLTFYPDPAHEWQGGSDS